MFLTNFFLFFKSFIDQGDTFNHSQTISHFNGNSDSFSVKVNLKLVKWLYPRWNFAFEILTQATPKSSLTEQSSPFPSQFIPYNKYLLLEPPLLLFPLPPLPFLSLPPHPFPFPLLPFPGLPLPLLQYRIRLDVPRRRGRQSRQTRW
jgi:hypothetical protein